MVLRGSPDRFVTLLRDGIQSGSIHIKHVGDPDPASESAKAEAEGRSRFIAADAWLLLHHASETLLRLYLAHSDEHPCPPLQLARQRLPGAFKSDVKRRFQAALSSEHYEANGRVFYGSPAAEGLSKQLDAADRHELLVDIESRLRIFAEIFLDAESCNAIKHGMAVQPGNSRLTVKVDEMDLGSTQGPHVEYLELKVKDDRKVWTGKTKWLDLDLILQEILVAHRLILALWVMARHRYLGEELDAVPSLLHPSAKEPARSESMPFLSMDKELLYDPSCPE